MGCASSSPLINGGGPGGVVESAKEAATKTATDVLHAGEAAIHDVGEHVKEAVQNVTHELENVLGGGKKTEKSDHINENDQAAMANGHGEGDDPSSNTDYQIIRLKGSKQNSVEETELMENMKNDLMTKAQSIGDDTDRLADDLIKETEELMRDAETGIAHHEMTTRITSAEDGTIEILNLEGNAPNSPNHSNDSLKTTSPEPEIERILAAGAEADRAPDSPKATLHSLAVPASEATRAGKDEGMPEEKPDVEEGSVWTTPQASLDSESMGSSVGEEHFRNEVLRATSIRTPGRNIGRRSPNPTARAPPPSVGRSERMQRFIFKLNSVILSDIEERVGAPEKQGIVRQLERNPEKVVELLSKSSVDRDDETEPDVDVTDDTPTGMKSRATDRTLRRQHSVSLEADTNDGSSPEEENWSDGRSREDASALESGGVQLKDISPAVRLRALMRFKSFDGFTIESSTERKKSRRRMKSLDSIDTDEAKGIDDGGQEIGEESSPDAYLDVPYDPEEEERICEELLAELRALEEADRADCNTEPNTTDSAQDDGIDGEAIISVEQEPESGPKTAWEKLQDYLQRVPKRRKCNYDLFYDSEEGILRTLFKHHKTKLLFHYSSSSSSDTL
ncbi:AGAP005328-PA-like protein [Anopheles sinensis]|uniref:AGAP005328-PA-like protein n=1 Tax=Anopheles sinensis TaxID=74873 RepID=A0A084VAU3_ANOSI|nr:AGAP005328-PA-like protein [Anopheles sinensis]